MAILLHSCGQLPGISKSFRIAKCGPYAEILASRLGKIGLEFAGFVELDNPAGPGAPIIFAGPRQSSLVERFASLPEVSDLVLLPLGPDNAWGWWEAFDIWERGQESPSHHEALLEEMIGEPPFQPPRYFGGFPEDVKAALPKILSVCKGLEDAQSLEVYRMSLFGSPQELARYYFAKLASLAQYFDQMPIHKGDIILNLGLHNGFEVPYMLSATGKEGHTYSLDPLGPDYLSTYVQEYLTDWDNHTVVPAAVHSAPGRVKIPIEGEQAQGKKMDRPEDFGLEVLECDAVSVDSFVKDEGLSKVDVIKMDIEGAERHALNGALETIASYRPSLATSIYHSVADAWDIPHFLMSHLDNYVHRIGLYSPQRFELIHYAIPRERL